MLMIELLRSEHAPCAVRDPRVGAGYRLVAVVEAGHERELDEVARGMRVGDALRVTEGTATRYYTVGALGVRRA